jgi:hypothetical protein
MLTAPPPTPPAPAADAVDNEMPLIAAMTNTPLIARFIFPYLL